MLRTIAAHAGKRHISCSATFWKKTDEPGELDNSKISVDTALEKVKKETNALFDPNISAEQALEEFRKKPKFENPITRTGKIFKRDFKYMGRKLKTLIGLEEDLKHDEAAQFFPTHTDVVIIGAGATGSSIAYWLSQRTRQGMNITVVDQPPPPDEDLLPYLTVGNICHQQLLPEKVQMSLFSAEFFRNFHQTLKVDNFPEPDIQYEPIGSLFLAGSDSADVLASNADMQNRLGVRNVLLSPEQLRAKFPWLSLDNVALGCMGLDSEGRFDTTAMINAFKQKSINYGVEFVQGRALGFEFQDQPHIIAPSKDGKYEQLERVIVQLPNGDVQGIKFGYCIFAAGADSGALGRQARIGEGDGLLTIGLPIERQERSVHYFTCPDGPGLNTPHTVDSSGVFFQRVGFGGTYVAGVLNNESQSKDFEVVKPHLVNRVPAFKNLIVKDTKTGSFEYNIVDDNGVIGPHPYYHNIVFATGFCGDSAQYAPAVGRGIMELLLDGEYKTVNFSRFNFERLCLNEPLLSLPRFEYIEP